jgi:hypothetical protein
LPEVVRLEIINQKNHSGSRSVEAHRRGPADFFSQIPEKQVYNYFWKPNSTTNMLKLLQSLFEFEFVAVLAVVVILNFIIQTLEKVNI